MANLKKKKSKVKVLTEEQLFKRTQLAFSRKIKSIFVGMGFTHLATQDKHIQIGYKKFEMDALYIYENIMIICEETCSKEKNKDHIRKKHDSIKAIKDHFNEFIEVLKSEFPEKRDIFCKYNVNRFKLYYLYFSNCDLNLDSNELMEFNLIKFVEPQTLNYFEKMVKCIKLSSRYEIFRYLNLKNDDIGIVKSDSSNNVIKAPIICPEDITGHKDGIRIVSFMMAAEKLIETCFVLRKDNWEDSMWLYQRLIDQKKIKQIRCFLGEKKQAFYNNIIVALPDNINLIDKEGHHKSINDVTGFEIGTILQIPNEINTICVIDGQHRIFAHHEGYQNDVDEVTISKLRKELHLLVTGLIFPNKMSKLERAKKQSEIFLDINSNAKSVSPDVLLNISMLRDPFSDIAIARRVVEKLNRSGVFKNMFELSVLDESKIKIASIIKFALRYLVDVSPKEGKESLINYWNGDKNALLEFNEEQLTSYINFCVQSINIYFSAVRKNLLNSWNDPDSKLLSVISINGFIIAFNRQLKNYGLRDFEYYDQQFKGWKFNFDKDDFPYTSSQYRKFSSVILKEVFSLQE